MKNEVSNGKSLIKTHSNLNVDLGLHGDLHNKKHHKLSKVNEEKTSKKSKSDKHKTLKEHQKLSVKLKLEVLTTSNPNKHESAKHLKAEKKSHKDKVEAKIITNKNETFNNTNSVSSLATTNTTNNMTISINNITQISEIFSENRNISASEKDNIQQSNEIKLSGNLQSVRTENDVSIGASTTPIMKKGKHHKKNISLTASGGIFAEHG